MSMLRMIGDHNHRVWLSDGDIANAALEGQRQLYKRRIERLMRPKRRFPRHCYDNSDSAMISDHDFRCIFPDIGSR